MSAVQQSLFKNKYLNGWRLFWIISASISLAVLVPFLQINTADAGDISAMIQQSVRVAVPWLFIAFAASALAFVFPNNFTRWILRNRRIFGLCFAAGMAWQLFFILWMVFGHFDYYMEEAYSYYDLAEQLPGYLILFAMTATSFHFGRKMLNRDQWRILHKTGIYFLWFVVWTTYWFELFYYEDIQVIDYAFYWMGIGALAVRMVAWAKKRRYRLASNQIDGSPPNSSPIRNVLVFGLVALGLALLVFGNSWAPSVIDGLANVSLGGWIELFIPFIAVIPLFIAAFLASMPSHKPGLEIAS